MKPSDSSATRKTTFVIDKNLHKELRKAVIDREVTMQVAIEEAIRLWLNR